MRRTFLDRVSGTDGHSLNIDLEMIRTIETAALACEQALELEISRFADRTARGANLSVT
jgi:hypothetical protein